MYESREDEHQIRDLINKDIDSLVENSPDFIEANRDTGEFKFKFVGLISPKFLNNGRFSKTILFMVFPNWTNTDFTNPSGTETMSLLVKTIALYSQKRRNSIFKQTLGTRKKNSLEFSSSIDLLFSIINFTNKCGIIREVGETNHQNKGEENWPKTFQKSQPMFSENTPIYPSPSRRYKVNLYTKLSKVHQDCYDYCATYMSLFFKIPIPYKHKWKTEFTSREIKSCKSTLSTALKRIKTQKNRKNIKKLKYFFDEIYPGSNQKSKTFGLKERAFHLLWEDVVLKTLGEENLTNKINQLFRINHIQSTVSNYSANLHFHKTDGALMGYDGEIVLFDAKHYREGTQLSTDDLLKQYSYEFGVNHFIQTGIFHEITDIEACHVVKNVFVKPNNNTQLGNLEPRFTVRGEYMSPYLQSHLRFSSATTRNIFSPSIERNTDQGLIEIGVDGFALMRRYLERNRTGVSEFRDFILSV